MEDLTPFQKAVIKAEYEIIVDALKKTKFRKGKAAELLGIDRKSIYLKLKIYHSVFIEEEQAA